MKKGLVSCLLTIGMLLSLLAGCGEAPAPESSSSDSVSPTEAPVSAPQQTPEPMSDAEPSDS